jgi:hypothetical protein
MGKLALALSLAILACGCGGTRDVAPEQSGGSLVTVAISPAAVNVTTSQQQPFHAVVTGTANTAVTWFVDGTTGGSASVGVISTSGVYTAPSTAGQHTVTVRSVSDASKSASASVTVTAATVKLPSVLTQRYDNARTGQNLAETVLTPTNVNKNTFGKIAQYGVDGFIYAQPLYVPNVSIPGQGTHNIVFVATEHDSVYAFDADAKAPAAFWHVSFIDATNGITTVPQSDVGSTVFPEIGITGTPVIDPSSNTLYVVPFTKENGNYVQRLHALDITTGQEKFGGPVTIQATVSGNGVGNDGQGHVPFQAKLQLQRSGLLLLNGVVYIAWGSHGDNGPYHGWIMGYSASNLQQIAVWNATPNGQAGSIWQSGCGLSADSQGNVYSVTSNGDFDLAFGGQNAGDSILRMTLNGSALTVADYFTPFDQQTLASTDNDLGASGLLLIPGTRLGTAGGKNGSVYLVNLDNLGHYDPTDNSQIVQYLPGAIGTAVTDDNFSTAAYFNGNVYYIGENDPLRQFAFSNGTLSNFPIATSLNVFGHRGSEPVISANGTNNAILWAIEYVTGGGNGILHAYDANNVGKELYNSLQAGGRDTFGAAVKFSVPTVVNGKVYVGAQSELAIFANQ